VVSSDGKPDAARRELTALVTVAVLLAIYLAFAPVAGWKGWAAAGRHPTAAAAVVITFGAAFVAVVVGSVVALCRVGAPPWAEAAVAAVLGGAFVAARATHHQAAGDALLVLAAVFLGRLVSRILREPSILVPVAVVAAVVDFWGVYWGFVAHVSKAAPKVAQSLSAPVPQVANLPTGIPTVGAMGVGDFLFLAIFIAALYRMGLRLKRTVWALVITLTVGPPLAFLASRWFFHYELKALPGLPFVALAVLAANWRQVRPSREERVALLWAAVTVAAVIGTYVGIRQLIH
jgi:hypothetical protein